MVWFDSFRDLPEEYRNDVTTASTYIRHNEQNYKYAGYEVKKNKKLALDTLSRDSSLIEFVPHELFADYDFVKVAIIYGCYVSDIPVCLDRHLSLLSVYVNSSNFQYLPEKFRDDEEIVRKAVDGDSQLLPHASERWRTNRDLVMGLLRLGKSVRRLDPILCDDKEIMETALSNGCLYDISEIGNKLIKDYDFVSKYFHEDHLCSKIIPKELFTDFNFLDKIWNDMPEKGNVLYFKRKLTGYLPDSYLKIHNLIGWIKGHKGNGVVEYNSDYDVLFYYTGCAAPPDP